GHQRVTESAVRPGRGGADVPDGPVASRRCRVVDQDVDPARGDRGRYRAAAIVLVGQISGQQADPASGHGGGVLPNTRDSPVRTQPDRTPTYRRCRPAPPGNHEGETAMPLLSPGDPFPQLTINT